jgi:hypothetical protein
MSRRERGDSAANREHCPYALGMKPTMVLMVAGFLLVAGCGHYEGTAPSDPAVDIEAPNASARKAPAKEISFTIVIRDVLPLDIYDDECRLDELPAGQLLQPPEHELIVAAGFDVDGRVESYAVPKVASPIAGGCETPGVRVRMPAAEYYSAGVASAGQGIEDPGPAFPHTFHIWDGGTVVIFE